jgi:hypothetical protein
LFQVSIIREQAEVLRKVHGYVSALYESEKELSQAMNEIIEELEDSEVQAMM